MRHGTRRAYQVQKCRCPACVMAQKRYHIDYDLRPDRHGLTDAEPARVHLMTLIAAGLRYREVADASGLSADALYRIRDGRYRTMQVAKFDALMAVTTRPDATLWRYVDAGPTLAIIAELKSRGFSYGWMERSTGIFRVPRPDQRYVRRWNEIRFQELAEFVGDSLAASKREIVRCDTQRLRQIVGTSVDNIAEVHGVTPRTLYRALRHGRINLDLLDAIATDAGLHVDELVVA